MAGDTIVAAAVAEDRVTEKSSTRFSQDISSVMLATMSWMIVACKAKWCVWSRPRLSGFGVLLFDGAAGFKTRCVFHSTHLRASACMNMTFRTSVTRFSTARFSHC